MKMEFEYFFLDSIEYPNKKTETFWVINKRSGQPIGEIMWHCPWRQYCFFPEADTIWNDVCLGDIMNTVKQLNEEHKARRD